MIKKQIAISDKNKSGKKGPVIRAIGIKMNNKLMILKWYVLLISSIQMRMNINLLKFFKNTT